MSSSFPYGADPASLLGRQESGSTIEAPAPCGAEAAQSSKPAYFLLIGNKVA
jgi:hypothetical protein